MLSCTLDRSKFLWRDEIPPGETRKIVPADHGAAKDFHAFAKQTRHELVNATEANKEFNFCCVNDNWRRANGPRPVVSLGLPRNGEAFKHTWPTGHYPGAGPRWPRAIRPCAFPHGLFLKF